MKEEILEETTETEAVAEQTETTENVDLYNQAKEEVIGCLALITNIDLNHSLGIEIEKYFGEINKETRNTDKFNIPNFTQALWNIYGDFIDHHKNEFETPEFQALDRQMHQTFMPKVVEILTKYSIDIATS